MRHRLFLACAVLVLASACGGSDDSNSTDTLPGPDTGDFENRDTTDEPSEDATDATDEPSEDATDATDEPSEDATDATDEPSEDATDATDEPSEDATDTTDGPRVACADLECGFEARVCEEPEGDDAFCGACIQGYEEQGEDCVSTATYEPFPGVELVAPMTFGEPVLDPGASAELPEEQFQFRERTGNQGALPQLRVVHLAQEEVPGRVGENVLAIDVPQVNADTLFYFALTDESFAVSYDALYRMGGLIGLSGLVDGEVPADLDFGFGLFEPANAPIPERMPFIYGTWSWAEALDYETEPSVVFTDRQFDFVGSDRGNGRSVSPGLFVRVDVATGPVRILVDNLRVSRVEEGSPLPDFAILNGSFDANLLPVNPGLALIEASVLNMTLQPGTGNFVGAVRHVREILDMGTGRAEQCIEFGRAQTNSQEQAIVQGRLRGNLSSALTYEMRLDFGRRTDLPNRGAITVELGYVDEQGFVSRYAEPLDFEGRTGPGVEGEVDSYAIRFTDVQIGGTNSAWRLVWTPPSLAGTDRVVLCNVSISLVETER